MDYLSRLLSCFRPQEEQPLIRQESSAESIPAEIDTIAHISFASLAHHLFQKGYETRQIRIISEEVNCDPKLTTLFINISNTDHQLLNTWIKNNPQGLQRVIDLHNKGCFPLNLQLLDGSRTLSIEESLLLLTECEFDFDTPLSLNNAGIFLLKKFSCADLERFIDLLKGKEIDITNNQIVMLLDFFEATSLLSDVIFLIRIKFNQATNIDEIEKIINEHENSWYLIHKKVLREILEFKMQNCRSVDEFERYLTIGKAWYRANGMDSNAEFFGRITLPEQATIEWIERLQSLRCGVDFNNCPELVSNPEIWKSLSHIRLLSLPSYYSQSDPNILYNSYIDGIQYLQELEELEWDSKSVDDFERRSQLLDQQLLDQSLQKLKSIINLDGQTFLLTSKLSVGAKKLKSLESVGLYEISNLPDIAKANAGLKSLRLQELRGDQLPLLKDAEKLESLTIQEFQSNNTDHYSVFGELKLRDLCVIGEMPFFNQFTTEIAKINELESLTLKVPGRPGVYVFPGHEDPLEIYFETVSGFENLKNLDIRNAVCLKNNLRFLANFPNLQSLIMDCSGSYHEPAFTDQIFQHLPSPEKLEEVELKGAHFIHKRSLDWLECASNLRKLRLFHAKCTDDDLMFLANKPIEELVLHSCNELTDNIGTTLKKLEHLKILTLNYGCITSKCIQEIAGHLPELKTLNINSVRMDIDGFRALSQFPNLEKLYIDGDSITSKGIREVEKILSLREIMYVRETPSSVKYDDRWLDGLRRRGVKVIGFVIDHS